MRMVAAPRTVPEWPLSKMPMHLVRVRVRNRVKG